MRSFKIVTISLAFSLASNAWAAPGEPDATFGTGGSVGAGNRPFSIAYSPIDGGVFTVSGGTVKRYTSGGVLDMMYGIAGTATVAQIEPHNASGPLEPGVIDSVGRLIIAGHTISDHDHIVVARLNTDGSLDATFGTGGTTTVVLHGSAANSYIASLALQSDGKIVISGDYVIATPYEEGSVVARLTAGGLLDGSFGTGGTFTLPLAEHDTTIAVQADDKIITSSSNRADDGTFHLRVRRFTANGIADPSFASGNPVDISPAIAPLVLPRRDDTFTINNPLVQSDQKIIVAGLVYVQMSISSGLRNVVMAARLSSDGTLDTGYGSGGFVAIPTIGLMNWFAALLPDDSLVLGPTFASIGGHGPVVKFDTDGAPDQGFGDCGTGDPVPGGVWISVAAQSDGKVLVGTEQSTFNTYWLGRLEEGSADVSAEPDVDEDGVPDACDLCPGTADAGQENRDGDLRGDACDLCTSLAERIPVKAKIKITHLSVPEDQKFNLKGLVEMPASPALDPLNEGVRIAIGTADSVNPPVIDYEIVVPPGAYDPETKIGWINKSGKFTYKNKLGFAGITLVKITPKATSPTSVTIKVKGKQMGLPADLDTTLIAVVQTGGNDNVQCGLFDSWTSGGSCELEVEKDKLSCARK